MCDKWLLLLLPNLGHAVKVQRAVKTFNYGKLAWFEEKNFTMDYYKVYLIVELESTLCFQTLRKI